MVQLEIIFEILPHKKMEFTQAVKDLCDHNLNQKKGTHLGIYQALIEENLFNFSKSNKLQCTCRTLGNAGGLHTGINPIHTVITFNRLICFRVTLRNRPGTGPGTGHTSYTFFLININNPVIPFNHCRGWTDWHAKRGLTVITRMKRKFGLWHTLD